MKTVHSLKVPRKLRRPPKFADKLNCYHLAKTRTEKACLLYEFPFNLNPSDISDNAQTWTRDSSSCSIITKGPVSSIFKKINGILGAVKQSPPNICYIASQNNVWKKYKNVVWETQQQLSLKSCLATKRRYVVCPVASDNRIIRLF